MVQEDVTVEEFHEHATDVLDEMAHEDAGQERSVAEWVQLFKTKMTPSATPDDGEE